MLNPPKWLIKFIGHIYIHKYFPFVVYKPQLHKVKGQQVRRILEEVRTGDLIFRRYDGYLSSRFIPGTYSHAGICIDNERVVHSIGNGGVVNEDILTFCRTDSIAIARPVFSSLTKSKATKTALEYVAKHVKYDYDFKRDNGSVYCTELINICYEHVFNSDYSNEYGNSVLTPDNMFKSRLCKKILEFKN